MPHPLSGFVASLLPIRDAEGREVAFAGDSPDESSDDALVVSLRVCGHHEDGYIEDIMEQQFTLVGPRHANHPALPEFLRASFAALPQIVREDGLMLPCWLFFPELLADESPDLSRLTDAAWRRDARAAAELGGRRETCAEIVGPERADGLAALFRPRWLLLSERVDEFDDLDDHADLADLDFEVSPSRLGGHPDLPPDFAWPRFGGDALTFLAQVDLADLPRLAGPDADLLPDHGVLSLFYNHDGDAEHGHGAVFWFPDRGALVPTRPPDEPIPGRPPGARVTVFPLYGLTAEACDPTLPGWEQPHYALLFDSFAASGTYPDSDADEFAPLRNFLRFEATLWPRGQPHHQLLGHPDVVQSDCLAAAAEAERAELGLPDPPHLSRAYAEQAAQWRLLLQIDSERDIALGDSGQIQVVIREPDLRARRFDCARIVFQCW